MAPNRRTTRLNPSATLTLVIDIHNTTSVTNAQIQAMINEGVIGAVAARDATINGDDSHTSGTGVRRSVQVAHECTYLDFLKCQRLNFKGTEGVVKFATSTLQGNALTWWNSHVKTTTHEAAHAMPWRTLKKMMTDKYCPRGEIKKLEVELGEFEGEGQVEQNMSVALPDTNQGSVMATKQNTMQDAGRMSSPLNSCDKNDQHLG
ncbi:reverse transcriptase domain-containing protein [Tanacetum coccineum]